jgi:hypothetical protein
MKWLMHTKFCSEDIRRKGLLEDIGVDGNVILKWILDKYGIKVWNGLETIRCSFFNSYGSSGFIKIWDFLVS